MSTGDVVYAVRRRHTPMINDKHVLTTGEVCHKLGLDVSVDYLQKIGCKPAKVTGHGAYWYTEGFPDICTRIGLALFDKAQGR